MIEIVQYPPPPPCATADDGVEDAGGGDWFGVGLNIERLEYGSKGGAESAGGAGYEEE